MLNCVFDQFGGHLVHFPEKRPRLLFAQPNGLKLCLQNFGQLYQVIKQSANVPGPLAKPFFCMVKFSSGL